MDLRSLALDELSSHPTPLLVVPTWREGDEVRVPLLPEPLRDVAERLRAIARPSDGHHVMTLGSPEGSVGQIALLALAGPPAELTAEQARRYAGHAVRLAEHLRLESLTIVSPDDPGCGLATAVQAIAEGATLAAWRFDELRAPDPEAAPRVTAVDVAAPRSALDVAQGATALGAVLAEAENVARMLQSRPGNLATPAHLADEAERLAAEAGLAIDVLDRARLQEERMGALLAVSAGSDEEPRLIVLRHQGGAADEAPLVLVGKGLTFDAGGISIKPAPGMEDMKFDMSGGAAVIAALWAIGRLGLKRNVIGIVPSSENLLSGSALKPGDVITTRSGKTVEVLNTDAEGRLILSDALDYARALNPSAIVDCATLTGAVVIGLGHHAMAVLGTDEELVDELRAAGDRTGERAWPLPLWDEYRRQLDSDIADLKNIGGRPGGTITAAWFLREFVGDVPWAHLDVAGTAYGDGKDQPYRRKGAYGVPTRILIDWVRSRRA